MSSERLPTLLKSQTMAPVKRSRGRASCMPANLNAVTAAAVAGANKGGRRPSRLPPVIGRSETHSAIVIDEKSPRAVPANRNARMKHGRGGPIGTIEAPGGSWQEFVAWVPNDAALKEPEPWKPLPQLQQTPPTVQPHQGGHLIEPPPLLGILPGSVAETKSESSSDNSSSSENSGETEKEVFEVLECWQASKNRLAKMRRTANASDGQSRYSGFTAMPEDAVSRASQSEHDFDLQKPSCRFIIHPHSTNRVVWDLSSLLMVVYDMIMIPMSAFHLPNNIFLVFMEWVTRLFWSADMVLSVSTGMVLADGTVEFELRALLKHYLKTWFALDLVIVGSDWAEIILSQTGVIGLGRLMRVFRIVRAVRLLRLVRMQEVVSTITERIQSDKAALILNMVKWVLFIVGVSHAIACCWWGIGDDEGVAESWVVRSKLVDSNIWAQYLVSLHWSLAQFSGGMDEVTPGNSTERFFAVVVWVFGFIAAAIMVSTLTSNQTQSHIIGGTTSRQLATLRKYLKQNSISSNLALRVQRSAQHAMSGELSAEAVEMLGMVSDPLKVAMHFEMYSGILRCHPFFCDAINDGPQVMRRVCHFAVSALLLSSGDAVFYKGELPEEPKMYFVSKGVLEYTANYGEVTTVTERQWVAEPALWTVWRHRGSLVATSDVKLAMVDAKTFQDLVVRYRNRESASFDPKLYAADFIAHLNALDEVTDLEPPS
eukprot:TRINITY_DN6452_c0_g1_i1.p1 TRINITY_DN6452_c0_g1~~TRINITY_DN6452_c0_g1_i1.p1  ORF type:complete len:825 (+),score=124.97 TRINITY_DN6452_c0_g1_i1:342-2477(+)